MHYSCRSILGALVEIERLTSDNLQRKPDVFLCGTLFLGCVVHENTEALLLIHITPRVKNNNNKQTKN